MTHLRLNLAWVRRPLGKDSLKTTFDHAPDLRDTKIDVMSSERSAALKRTVPLPSKKESTKTVVCPFGLQAIRNKIITVV